MDLGVEIIDVDDVMEDNDAEVSVTDDVDDVMEDNDAEVSVTLERDKFDTFASVAKAIYDAGCSDLDIKGGLIRQKNDTGQMIIEMDMNDVIGDIDLSLVNLKQKVQILKTFDLDGAGDVKNTDMSLTLRATEYQFGDSLSKVIFMKSVKSFLNNPHISDDEYKKLIKYTDDNKLMDVEIGDYMSRRIKNVCDSFESDMLRCDLNDGKANFSIATLNNMLRSDVLSEVDVNGEWKEQYFRVKALPFFMNWGSDMTMSVYRVRKDTVLCKFDFGLMKAKIPVSVFCQAKIDKDVEGDEEIEL